MVVTVKCVMAITNEPLGSRDSSVGIASRLRAVRPGLRIVTEISFFSSQKRPNPVWGPPIDMVSRYRGCFTGLKRPGREADHSPLSSA